VARVGSIPGQSGRESRVIGFGLTEHFLGGVDAAGVVAGVEEGLEVAAGTATDIKDPAAGCEGDGEMTGGRAAGGDVTSGEIGGIGGVELGGARVHGLRGEGSGKGSLDPQEM
jgi:hypothetical protein